MHTGNGCFFLGVSGVAAIAPSRVHMWAYFSCFSCMHCRISNHGILYCCQSRRPPHGAVHWCDIVWQCLQCVLFWTATTQKPEDSINGFLLRGISYYQNGNIHFTLLSASIENLHDRDAHLEGVHRAMEIGLFCAFPVNASFSLLQQKHRKETGNSLVWFWANHSNSKWNTWIMNLCDSPTSGVCSKRMCCVLHFFCHSKSRVIAFPASLPGTDGYHTILYKQSVLLPSATTCVYSVWISIMCCFFFVSFHLRVFFMFALLSCHVFLWLCGCLLSGAFCILPQGIWSWGNPGRARCGSTNIWPHVLNWPPPQQQFTLALQHSVHTLPTCRPTFFFIGFVRCHCNGFVLSWCYVLPLAATAYYPNQWSVMSFHVCLRFHLSSSPDVTNQSNLRFFFHGCPKLLIGMFVIFMALDLQLSCRLPSARGGVQMHLTPMGFTHWCEIQNPSMHSVSQWLRFDSIRGGYIFPPPLCHYLCEWPTPPLLNQRLARLERLAQLESQSHCLVRQSHCLVQQSHCLVRQSHARLERLAQFEPTTCTT